ncbi:probable terpene synthase 2 isoform X2 [Vicia villosa]|uniref:probable terpene synthase 2 isoform X2 n=1 Tax=Vicia villosa TaxID=3911 RepID=UPI00273B96C1|nr:probable terpene synthase 2 isoform X2 [Vicia villosa]
MPVDQCFNRDAKYDLHRNVADFQPSIWGNYFLQYASESMELDQKIETQIETLKYDVRKMLVAKSEKPFQKVHLIDSICRLGVSYYFEKEIEENLQYIHRNSVENGEIIFEDNLYSLAVLFRLLRQQGLYVSPNVFNKYKDDKGSFSETLIKDVEGMLSLYEATHLMIHGEDILEEALAFTTTHLESIANQSSHPHATQVKYSLRQTIHKNLPRLEARRFISIYEQDPLHIENLLLLAKLDFNMLQTLHQKEFGIVCKWWNELDVHNKLPYARDRLIESCFWALTIYFESQYSTIRKTMMKIIITMTTIDDTYDAYGTMNELELFTKAIERWNCLDNLPAYMKFLYGIILDLYEELEHEMKMRGKVFALNYHVKELKKYVQAYMTEARWLNNNYKPTLEEYIRLSIESSGYVFMVTTCFMGMGEIVTEDILKWVANEPTIVNASIVIGRLMDDIVSNEFEQKRDHISSFLECYMKKYNVSRDVAIQEGRKRIVGAWKDMNKECLIPTQVPVPFLKRILNLSRFMDVVYKDKDNFTHPEGEMKTFIKLLLVDPVPI